MHSRPCWSNWHGCKASFLSHLGTSHRLKPCPSQGSFLCSVLSSSSTISSLDIISRRQPPSISADHPKTKVYISSDTTTWPTHLTSHLPSPQIFFSALATTRAAAGGFSQQYALEHDVNIEVAKAAKQAGTRVFVLISSAGADKNAMSGYFRMKGEIEEDIKKLDFAHTVILRPGLIAGHRAESRPTEAVLRKVAALAGMVSTKWLKDGWAQEADVIAKAAVNAGIMAAEGKTEEKVWLLNQRDIIRLGRTEWKDDS